MPSEQEIKKTHDTPYYVIKSFFEVKRPVKAFKSATLPRTNMQDANDDVSKERIFTRHHSYRKSSRKYKNKKHLAEKIPEHSTSASPKKVTDKTSQFESEQVNNAPNKETKVKTNKPKQNTIKYEIKTNNKNKTNKNISPAEETCHKNNSDELIRKIQEERDKDISMLKGMYKNVEIQRRVFEKNNPIKEKKIKSFVEAENAKETELYRQSLLNEMDKELVHMKEDGFIDDDENTLQDNIEKFQYAQEKEQYCTKNKEESNDIVSSDTFLAQMRRNANKFNENTDFTETVIVNTNETDDTEDANDQITQEYMAELSKRFQIDFNDSLADILENELRIVEAYNDNGRELVEVKILIDRHTLNVETNESSKSFNDAYKSSDMIFCENGNHQLELVEKVPYHINDSRFDEEYSDVSNRYTVYSTTSQDSSIFDEDYEYITRNKDQNEIYQNARRETFCDDKGNVRIERVIFGQSTPFENELASSPVSRSNSTVLNKRFEYIMDEIKQTERKYVEDLAKTVKIYKPYIEAHIPPHLTNYVGYLFGNIEKIYKRQKVFFKSIEKCEDIDMIVECFIDQENLFTLYPCYFTNKPMADSILKEFTPIIKEMQEKYEERLDFSAYLLTPVQRLGKYILFLENIEKQLEKMDLPKERAQMALEIVRNEMSKGNDQVAIESIKNSPISKLDYGSFIMREKFNVMKPKKTEVMVFLFTNVVVITTPDVKSMESFIYYGSIKMTDLRIASFDNFTLHLTDFTKSKKVKNATSHTFILETKTEKIWKSWKQGIEKILWDQLVKAKENSLHTNSLKSNGKNKEARRRIISAGSSVFYCE